MSSASSSSGGLDTWVYAVIGVAGAVFLCVVILVVIFCCRKQRGESRPVTPRRYSYGKASRIPDFDPDSEEQELTFMKQSATLPKEKKTSVGLEVEDDEVARVRAGTAFVKPTVIDEGDAPITIEEEAGGIRVKMTRKRGEPLGITTAPQEYTRGMMISEIKPGSAAFRSQAFRVGDLLLSINSREVLNASHEAVVLALEVCEAAQIVEILISRPTAPRALNARDGTPQPKKSMVETNFVAESSTDADENQTPAPHKFNRGSMSQLEAGEGTVIVNTEFKKDSKPEEPASKVELIDFGKNQTPIQNLTGSSTEKFNENPGTMKRKRTRTIKKEGGRLIMRLRQLAGSADTADRLPYKEIRLALIEEFGKEQFDAKQQFVKGYLKEIGYVEFELDSSTDPTAEEEGKKLAIGRSVRLKSIKMDSVKKYLTMKQSRTATGWFKEVTANGKKQKRYCIMKGNAVELQEKKKELVTRDKFLITIESGIQRHGYDLFVINPDRRWHLIAESQDQCDAWYKELRATYIEMCDKVAAAEEAQEAAKAAKKSPEQSTKTSPPPEQDEGEVNAKFLSNNGEKTPEKEQQASVAKADSTSVTKQPESPVQDANKEAGSSTDASAPQEKTEDEKRAERRAALAAKRAAAKAARANNLEAELKEIFAWIDALPDE